MSRKLFAALLTTLGLASAAHAQAAQPAPAPAAADVPASKPDSSQATPTPLAAPAPSETPPALQHLNAGYAQGNFFLRSDDDNFIFIPTGRLQYDFYGYEGAGRDKQPFATFNPKRARIEVMGTIMKHWDFQLGSELTNGSNPTATDIYLNANYTPYANFQFGQFDAPFTMENRTSDKWTDMQERARAVGAFALPENKEVGAMVWGMPQKKWAYWSAGLFNGEGIQQFKHTSNHFDLMGRAWIAPAGMAGNDLLKNVWVGGSVYNGFRGESPNNEYYKTNYSSTFGSQLDRPSMKDTAGVTFFSPVSGTVHAGDYGQRTGYAGEINAPIKQFVFKGEFIHLDEGLRELDLGGKSPAYVRTSKISGNAFYARASYFFWGDPLINGLAGQQVPPRLFGELKPGKTQDALQLVAQWDHIGFDYTADNDPSNKDALAGRYNVDIYGVGLNYWYTKHIRLTTDFLYDNFSGSAFEKADGTAKGTPLAPSSHAYEGTFRVALAI